MARGPLPAITRGVLQKILRWALAAMLVGQGINHFVSVDFFMRMMPAYLPAPEALIYLSGVAEVALGVMVMVPTTRRLAGWGIFALLIAVFPANVQMALHPEQWPELPEFALYLRLPLQLVFAYWGYAACLRGRDT